MASTPDSAPVQGGQGGNTEDAPSTHSSFDKLIEASKAQEGSKSKVQGKGAPAWWSNKRKDPPPVGVDQFNLSKRDRAKLRKKGLLTVKEGLHEDVLALDIKDLADRLKLADTINESQAIEPSAETAAEGQASDSTTAKKPLDLPEAGSEIDVKVLELSSTGEGLAVLEGSSQIYVVSFVVPGDVAKVKVFSHNKTHSVADLLSIVTPSPARDDKRILCGHFSRCGGCQLQPMSYEDQLSHKRKVVEKAFKNFSDLPPELIPAVGETIGSPLQYHYRTKLTPHYNQPPGARRKNGPPARYEELPPIGFQGKGKKVILDIEDCPIGTEVINKGLKRERARVASEFRSYTNGATILLRESTERFYKKGPAQTPIPDKLEDDQIRIETENYVEIKSCISDGNKLATEYVENYIFKNKASGFFQNNNSILPLLTGYVRDNIIAHGDAAKAPAIRNLIDAYCGSGLFTITCAPLFMPEEVNGRSIGVDIDMRSIEQAGENAIMNDHDKDKCRFMAADAPKLFQKLDGYNPDETAVVIDPPRKGCDASFLTQLMVFKPQRLVYVSCNVHTQARDVGILVRGHVDGKPAPAGGARYNIESVRGFDLFPQTSHVEGVAVLTRVDDEADVPMST